MRFFKLLFPFFLFMMIGLLSSCSHTKGDGPPNFYVDETRIPNAVPKPEPLAKYGNYKSYIVFGKRYYTLPSSNHYDEVGTASWYGMKFNARKTSSGERYNLLGMTAAHKTLPLPTYVEVINLRNNRRVVVKVNDRGPFASNRIIDLSYVAAKKLGMIGHGTARVRVRAINPNSFNNAEPFFVDSRPVKKRPLFAGNKNKSFVYLQVGAFHNKNRAKKLQIRLSSLFRARVLISHPSLNGQLYRVKIGPFHDMTAANQMTDRLKELGIYPNKIKN